MTLSGITVSHHMGYKRRKPALKITAFTHTQLLVRLFSLFLCTGIASVLAHKQNDMKYESENCKKKKKRFFFFE